MHKSLFIVFLLAFSQPLTHFPGAYAEETQKAEIAYHYIGPAAIHPTLIEPPLKEGTDAWKKEADAVLKAQQQAAEEQIKEAEAERTVRPEIVTGVLGEKFTRERLPKTFALLDKVEADAQGISDAAKVHWNTKRPFQADERIKPSIEPAKSPAYPSGHTAISLVLAEVLGQLLPDSREKLRMRARDIAMHRVITGLHFPFDLEGGWQLGYLILGALQQNPAFREDVAAARAELAEAGF